VTSSLQVESILFVALFCSTKLFKLCSTVYCFYNISCISYVQKCRLLHGEKASCPALYCCICCRCWSKLFCCQSISVYNCNQCSGIV